MIAGLRYRCIVILTSSRHDTRFKIIEVAARLLDDQGAAGVTTRAVAEGAGVQAPAIYRLFGDKDGLLDAVAEHVMATHVSAKAAVLDVAAAQDVDPLEDLRAGWDTQIAFGLAHPAVFRLLTDPGRVLLSPGARAGRALLETRVRRIAATGRLRMSERRAVDLIHAAGTGIVQALLATPPKERDEDLAEIMYTAVLRQILTEAPDPAASGPTAAAVALRAVSTELAVLTDAERQLLTEWLDRVVADLSRGRA